MTLARMTLARMTLARMTLARMTLARMATSVKPGVCLGPRLDRVRTPAGRCHHGPFGFIPIISL